MESSLQVDGTHDIPGTPTHLVSSKVKDALLCAVLPIAAVLVALPFVEMVINDKSCSTQIAQHPANTGKMAYNGASLPIVGFQVDRAAFVPYGGAEEGDPASASLNAH